MTCLRLHIILLVFVVFILQGCYPGGPSNSDDFNIVRTRYNSDYDFGSQKTYYIPDTIIFTSNIEDDQIDASKLANYEAILIEAINRNMAERNYERIIDTAIISENGVDLVILPCAILSHNSSAVWWPSPGWWYDYYPPGWGWGGGWYYPPGWGGYWSYYSYTSGTVIINMTDYTSYSDSEGEYIEVEWDVLIDGLLSGVNASKISSHIDQAFTQSPYIASN